MPTSRRTLLRGGAVAEPGGIKLVPMGAARLRITASAAAAHENAWTAASGSFRPKMANSGMVTDASKMACTDSARIVQFKHNGTAAHLRRLL